MTKKQERHIIASVGTVLFMILLFLILWFMRLYSVKEAEQEGIEVAFGEVAEAGGYMAEQSEAVPMPAPQPVAPAPQPKPEEPVLTAEEEQALAMQQAQKKKEQEEKARLEAERRQREKEAAEKKAKEDAAVAKANQFGALFGKSGNATGSGDSQGAGQKGNPVGHGSIGGNDWSLNGRDIKSLPAPSKDFKQEGKVVVQIKVDAAGNVIDARETAGNTISDKQTIQLALEAAKKAKFTEGDHDQIGTITYIFKLN